MIPCLQWLLPLGDPLCVPKEERRKGGKKEERRKGRRKEGREEERRKGGKEEEERRNKL